VLAAAGSYRARSRKLELSERLELRPQPVPTRRGDERWAPTVLKPPELPAWIQWTWIAILNAAQVVGTAVVLGVPLALMAFIDLPASAVTTGGDLTGGTGWSPNSEAIDKIVAASGRPSDAVSGVSGAPAVTLTPVPSRAIETTRQVPPPLLGQVPIVTVYTPRSSDQDYLSPALISRTLEFGLVGAPVVPAGDEYPRSAVPGAPKPPSGITIK
jgi:hypothetical protein